MKKHFFQVIKEIQFCYGHRLMNYRGRCMHPHGHNGKVLISIAAPKLDPRGMVMDFGEIKNHIQSWINQELDHKMILQKKDPLIKVLKEMGEPVFIMDQNPTAENIAKLIFDFTKAHRFPVLKVEFWETPSSCAVYGEKE